MEKEELILPKPKKPVEGSCYFCKFYVQPLNKANNRYDACCFGYKLNFKKSMTNECSLRIEDPYRNKEQK